MAHRSSVPPVESLTPPRPSGGLTFLSPEPETDGLLTSPSDLPSEQSSPHDPLDSSSRSGSEPTPDASGEPSDADPTSSPGSSGTKPSALSKKALRDAVRKAVLIAGDAAHKVLARDKPAQEVGLYLTDEDDAEAIGDPLSNIAHRRGGLGAAGNPDVADAIAALIGLGLYAWKQLSRAQIARELRQAEAQTAGLATPEAAAALTEPAGA